MTKDQLQLLSVAVLRDMAKKSGVKSVSALRKSALVDALLENQKNQSENSSGHGSEPAGSSLKDRGAREDHGRQNPDREENRAHASDAGRKTAKTCRTAPDTERGRCRARVVRQPGRMRQLRDTAAGRPAPGARAVRAAVPAARAARRRGPEDSCGEGRPGSWQEAGSQ